VLGFDGAPPETLPYEVSLDPEPLTGGSPDGSSGADAEARVTELAAAEADAAGLSRENERRFRRPPALPRAQAPRLRVRLAVARSTEPGPELTAIAGAAAAALADVAGFSQRSQRWSERLEDLRRTLEVNRVRAARHFGDEDSSLGDLHDQAARALWKAPIDLTAARGLVDQYAAEADRRIEERDRG
jgi:hypothetical protein